MLDKRHHERGGNPPAFGRACCICLGSGLDAEMAFLCAAGRGEARAFPRAGAGGSHRAAGAEPCQGLITALGASMEPWTGTAGMLRAKG